MNKYQGQILYTFSETPINMHESTESIIGNNLIGKSDNTGSNSPTTIDQGEHILNASNSATGITQITLFINKSLYLQKINKGYDSVTISGTSCRLIVTFTPYSLDVDLEIYSNKVFKPKFWYSIQNKDPPLFVY